jgi:hypothetical protein
MVEVNVETSTGLRVTCNRDELARRLSVVSRALSMRSTVQILSGVLLEASGERLALAATGATVGTACAQDASRWIKDAHSSLRILAGSRTGSGSMRGSRCLTHCVRH